MQWTLGNPKTGKGESVGYLTAVLHLSPSTGSGHNVCARATPGCIVGCLNKAGRGGIPSFSQSIQQARIRRTLALFENREAYINLLSKELRQLQWKALREGLILVARPNGTSDLPWLAHALAERHPEIQFYDYTKLPMPWRRELPNYHLTFSRSETNEVECHAALRRGLSVAVVFDTKKGEALPESYWGHRVVDGDETDLRFLDERGVIVGLRAKGPAKKDHTGFVVSARQVEYAHEIFNVAQAAGLRPSWMRNDARRFEEASL